MLSPVMQSVIVPRVFMLSAVLLSVIILGVIMLSIDMMSVFILHVKVCMYWVFIVALSFSYAECCGEFLYAKWGVFIVMLSVIMLDGVMLSVIMLSVIMLSVIMLSVVHDLRRVFILLC
jgi:hypothetical protein